MAATVSNMYARNIPVRNSTHMYICTYVHMYICTYMYMWVHMYMYTVSVVTCAVSGHPINAIHNTFR